MKDFDEKRRQRRDADRSFQIHGETFQRRPGVRPEALTEYEGIGQDTDPGDVLEIIDRLILSMVETDGDGEARYRAIREDEADPVTLGDLTEVVKWLVEEETGRPTQQPLPFTPGPPPPPTGTSSTDASSSPGERAA